MLKYLLIALLVWLVVVPLLKRMLARPAEPAQRADPPPTPPQTQEIVQCAHCGIHLPEAEAHHDLGGLPYCSAEHARLGRRPG
ncbi:hypothetical protein DEH84_10880 [Aquabacterium olei]|uniref:Preprotein translocase subunit YajC n=1 Tax=Aquabacterium olei TaxID=1296669 RepID=A0A2U8FUG5_9BURK|nr:PP0621 family protein [Aquabacterium olei]AWI53876.1 hypothetical protein DEH84_10880 [Aquabacterium olei]